MSFNPNENGYMQNNQSYNQQNGYTNNYQYDQNSYYNNNSYYATNGSNYSNGGNSYSGSQNRGGLYGSVSDQTFNLVIGGTLLYGFLINCFMVKFCFDSVLSVFMENPLVFYIGYIIMIIAGTLMVNKSDNPIISFIGYNFYVIPLGMIISLTVNVYVAVGYSDIVAMAFGITAILTIAMMVLSSVYPQFFLSLGRTLGVSLLITVIIEIILFIAHAPLGIIDYIVVLIFSGYIGYDWAVANRGPKTVDKAIDSAAELYVDIVNLFLRILRILARAQRN